MLVHTVFESPFTKLPAFRGSLNEAELGTWHKPCQDIDPTAPTSASSLGIKGAGASRLLAVKTESKLR